jgi:shikimate dehydrogenase
MVLPTGSTRVAGVIGDPIRHSLSPIIHNAAFTALGMDWVFLAFAVPEGQAGPALAGCRSLGLEGLSVTMPHKTAVASLVDRLSPTATALGAVNTVVRTGGGLLMGESTDGTGFLDALRLDHGIDPAGMRVAVLGAGGAARAVVLAVAEAGASEVVVVNRTRAAAERAATLAGRLGRVGTPEEAGAADVVVNATPLGMEGPGSDALPIAPGLLRPGQIVVDLVYSPRETPLLRAAAVAGASGVGGLGMLVHQAAHAFRLWTGCEAPLEAMSTAAARATTPSSFRA